MAQALVVSDNEVINDLYSLNLKVYLDTNTTVKSNHKEAIALLEMSSNFDLIVCFSAIEGQDAPLEIFNYLQGKKLQIPLIVVGRSSDIDPEKDGVSILPASFNIRSLVRTGAKLLEITAKDMAEKVVPEHYPIPLKLFFNIEKSPCDVYYRVKKGAEGSEYLKIFAKGDIVSKNVRKYYEEGVPNLYVDALERLTFINHTSEKIVEILNSEDLAIEERMEATEQGIELVADQVFENKEVNEEVINISNACIRSMQEVVNDSPKITNLLNLLLSNKSGFVYTHSILSTYVARHIVNNISWGGDSHIEKISFVLFFHDMYLTPIFSKYPHLKYEEDLLFGDVLSDKEKEVLLNHAKNAGEMVQTFPRAPLGADVIITQHHGVTNGLGFAVQYKDDISPLAKVIIIAEHFTEEILKALDEKRSFNKEATMKMLHEKFKRQTYTKIVDTLANIEM